ncbi:MAG: hypothetical protein KGI27_12515 [Thaumarchaeota archaeon]|nr:hypothetical protein [Nitrososphaerota archaeon]
MLCCQSGHDEEPKRPRLYLGMDLLEFREEVVRGILDEMLEESGKEIKEIGLDHIRNEIEYDVTESIREHGRNFSSEKNIKQ